MFILALIHYLSNIYIVAVFNLKINGKVRKVDVDPSTPVLWLLRDHLDLRGTKFGCGVAQCGALLKSKPNPSDEDIEAHMSGNICRCGTYIRVKEAVKSVRTFDIKVYK